MSSGENVGAAAPLLPRRKQHREGCPGCRLDEINKTKTGIPYLNFFYIWVVCLTACKKSLLISLSLSYFLLVLWYPRTARSRRVDTG
jgi:hypothetical protein